MSDGVATTEAKVSGKSSERQRQERRFYSGMALIVALAIFIGFAPSFYLKPFNLVHFPRPNPELNQILMFHGLVFSLWVMVFIVQTQLVAAGRRDLHRAFGIFGFSLAVVMIPIIYFTTVDEVARGAGPPFVDVLTWSAVPLVPILFYALVLWKGWSARRVDLQAHKRFMLGLMIMFAQPAVSRYPIAPPTLSGFAALSLIPFFLFIPLILWDRKRNGAVHPATRFSIGVFALIWSGQILFLALPGVWSGFAAHLPGMPG